MTRDEAYALAERLEFIANDVAGVIDEEIEEACDQAADAMRQLADRSCTYHCDTHGDWNAARESGCPTCVRELREELERIHTWIALSGYAARDVSSASWGGDVMPEIDHDAAIRTMRALCDDMDNWPDEDNYSVALDQIIAIAEQAKGLAEALDNLVLACELPGEHCEIDQALPGSRAALARYREKIK